MSPPRLFLINIQLIESYVSSSIHFYTHIHCNYQPSQNTLFVRFSLKYDAHLFIGFHNPDFFHPMTPDLGSFEESR